MGINSINMDMVIIGIVALIILIIVRYTITYSRKINYTYNKLSMALLNLKNYFANIQNNNEDIQNAINELNNHFVEQNGSREQYISYAHMKTANTENFAILKQAWDNYFDKINIEYCCSFIHPKEFFNRDYLLSISLENRDFIKTIPSLLTSIGLAGTFTAILLGLIGIDPSNMETINQLIHGLWGKFLSSIVALVCAILFVRNEKQKYSELNDRCINLQNTLIRIFPIQSETEILFAIQNNMNKQAKRMEKVLSSIEEQSLAGVQEMVNEMRTSLSALENQSLKGVTEMVRKFEKVLSENAVEHFEHIAGIIKELSVVISDIHDCHKDYLENMESIRNTSELAFENQQKIVEMIENNMNNIKEDISKFSNLISLNKEYFETLDRTTQELAYAGEQFNATVPSLIEIHQSIKDLSINLNSSIAHFRDIADQLSYDKFEPVVESLRDNVTNIVEKITSTFMEIENYFDDIPETMSRIIQEQIADITNAMDKYSETTNKFLEKYDDNIRAATNMLHTNIENTETAFEDNIKTLNSNFNKLNKTLETVNLKIGGNE